MTPEERSQLRYRLYLLGPLAAAIGGVVVAVSGLADFVQKQVPASFSGYTNHAMNLAPFGWLVLALGCSIGTCLHLARSKEMTGWTLVFWFICVTPSIFFAQVVICAGIAIGGCILVGGKF